MLHMHIREITTIVTERDAEVASLQQNRKVHSHHLRWIVLFNNIDDNDFPLLSISHY